MCICVGFVYPIFSAMSRVMRQYGSWSMAAGIRHATFLPLAVALQEARHRLKRRVPSEADVVRVGEAEDRLHRAHRDPLRHLQPQLVDVPDVVGVAEDVRQLRLHTAGDHVQRVIVGVSDGLVECQVLPVEEFLVVGHLEVELGVVRLLEVGAEEPRQ